MQKFAVLMLTVLLASGLLIAFLMYRQLGTESVTLSGTPELVATSNGAECGEISFSIWARSIGKWFFNVPKSKTIMGTVTVGGARVRTLASASGRRPIVWCCSSKTALTNWTLRSLGRLGVTTASTSTTATHRSRTRR